MKEFQEAGYGDTVFVKAADEDMDRRMPSVDSEYKIGYELTKELLREHKGLTAIAGLNDMIALGHHGRPCGGQASGSRGRVRGGM